MVPGLASGAGSGVGLGVLSIGGSGSGISRSSGLGLFVDEGAGYWVGWKVQAWSYQACALAWQSSMERHKQDGPVGLTVHALS